MYILTFIIGILLIFGIRFSIAPLEVLGNIPISMIIMAINMFCIMLNYAEKSRRGLKTASTIIHGLELVIYGVVTAVAMSSYEGEFTLYLYLLAFLFIIMLLVIYWYTKNPEQKSNNEVKHADTIKKWKELLN